jgi:pimeloyl-ACP methyl ester carboxylesterase
MLPDAIAAAAAGEYGPLFALNAQTSAWSLDTMSLPVTLAVLCAEEMHRVTPAQAARAGTGFTGDGYHRAWRAACDAWPHRALPAAFAEPVRADIPVLVLSGAADPATPPARGAEAAAQFPQHRHLVVANAAHGVSALGCVPSLIGTFVAEGSADHLDAACLDEIAWPPLPAAGHARAEDAR